MLSKCANPQCFEQFRFLHQGKLFHLTPTPEIQMMSEEAFPALYERFWLCDRCSQQMTLTWAGTHVKLAPLPSEPRTLLAVQAMQVVPGERLRYRLAHAASRSR